LTVDSEGLARKEKMQERKLRNRIIFELTGRWPQSVVAERLSGGYDPSNVNAVLASLWEDAGYDYVPLTGNAALDVNRGIGRKRPLTRVSPAASKGVRGSTE
jgi:hypothetical protein